jgi:diguanylate cyclase (GGDEF)-like protein
VVILQLRAAPTDQIGVKSAVAGTARRRQLSGAALVLAVVLVGAVASIGASAAVDRGQKRLSTQAMDTYIGDLSDAINDEVEHYGDALADVVAGIDTHPDLTSAQFAGLIAHLSPKRLPGVSGVAFVVPAFDEELSSVQATWRSRGATGLSLYRTGAGVEHDYTIFGRSFTELPFASGRDLAQIPQNADALRIARDTGAFTMSRAHVLARERALGLNEQQMSFTLTMPVFGATTSAGARHLRGWIIMGVHGGEFLNETLRNQSRGAIQVRLADPGGVGTVIAQVTAGTRMTDRSLYRSRLLLVGQHTWDLDLWPTDSLLSANDRWGGTLTMIGGLFITILLATLVGLLAGGRSRAMAERDEYVLELQKDKLELERLAFHDHLTGLANRGLFYDRVGQALKSHTRTGESFAVFFIDLDGFKQVNDELGHRAGDMVLCEVADRLRDCLRDSDTVARFGGDEFAVITERLAGPEDVHITAGRIVAAVQQPIDVGRQEALVTASVGIALNRPGDSADDILREADVAMYTAKTTGKCRHVLAGAA